MVTHGHRHPNSSTTAERALQSLLLDLANLSENQADYFWKKWRRMFKPDQGLLVVRDELRQVWRDETPEEHKNDIIRFWLKWRPTGLAGLDPRLWPWRVSFEQGRLLPAPGSMRSALAFAALTYHDKLRLCHNSECISPYFIGRKGQKYCERGDCTKYAQRLYALRDWKKKGAERRRKRMARSKGKTRKKSRG